MGEFLRYTIFGLAVAGVYFIAASGIVVTYTASGIFNFAHGAVAMIAAFTYWDLRVQHDWPAPIALAVVLFVLAPVAGIVIERVVMRNLGGAATITGIVVTIGLLVALLGIGSVVWAPSKFAQTPSLPRFFEANVISVFGTPIAWHYLFVVGFSVLVAFGLWVLLRNTRLGIAMRAVVDDRNLARLNGENPAVASAASWVIGCMLAALAGVLLAPILALDVARLTLLIINAYVVAVVGRLRSLPLTALGAVILGLSLSYFDWGLAHVEHVPVWVQSVHDSLPIIMLFVVLLLMPQDRTRLTATLRSSGSTAVVSSRIAIGAGVAFVAVAWFAEGLLHGAVLRAAGLGLGLAIVMLSIVLLTGYAGQISLAQLAFAGLGALAASWLPGQTGASPVGLLIAAAFAGLVGAIVAIPCLRMRDLYLALGTMAFALVVEQNVLGQISGFASDSKVFARWSPVRSDKAYFVVIAAVFVLLAWLVIALRRGEFGRRLQAMKDSPTACTTLGLDLTRTKVQVFALGAAIAGAGGFLMAGWKGTVGKDDFSVLTGPLSALPVLLLVVVGGVTVVSGALIGALLLVSMPQVAADYPSLNNLMILLPGLVGISLARNPDGLVSDVRNGARRVRAKLVSFRSARAFEPAMLPAAPLIPELVGLTGRVTASDLRALDRELGFATEECNGAA
jgi:branched-subunit amino acid ABC-type transport system permease component